MSFRLEEDDGPQVTPLADSPPHGSLLAENGSFLLTEDAPDTARSLDWVVRFAPPKWSFALSAKWRTRQAATKWETGAASR